MIGHQHVGVDGAAVLASGVGQELYIKVPVVIGEKAGVAVVATLDDVDGNARQV